MLVGVWVGGYVLAAALVIFVVERLVERVFAGPRSPRAEPPYRIEPKRVQHE